MVKIKLDEITTIIKHREKSIQLSFWDIGKDLNFIQERKVYKEKYNSLKEYIKDNFSFSYDHARKIMFVTGRYSRAVADTIGITKLYLLLQVPEQHRDEVLELVKDKKIDREALRKQIKRFKTQSGNTPYYTKDKEEHLLSLKRQVESLFEQYDDFMKDFKESFVKWLKESKKYNNSNLKKMELKANKILETIDLYYKA